MPASPRRAVGDRHVLAGPVERALERDRVVVAVEIAVGDGYVAAAVDVQAVVVVGRVVVDGDAPDRDPLAGQVVLHPHGGASHGHALDRHPAAADQADGVGPREVFRPAELGPVAVDGAPPADGDVLEVLSGDEAAVHVVVGVGADRGDAAGIVVQLFAAQERAAGLEEQADVALQADGSRAERSRGEIDRAPAAGRARVDRLLDRRGAKRLSVVLGAEIADVKPLFGPLEGKPHDECEKHRADPQRAAKGRAAHVLLLWSETGRMAQKQCSFDAEGLSTTRSAEMPRYCTPKPPRAILNPGPCRADTARL